MEKENHSYPKLKISRILKCPFWSCNRRSIPNVIAQRDPPATKPRQLIELFSPRISTNRIRRPQIVKTVDQSFSMAKELVFPRRKDSSSYHRNSFLLPGDKKDRRGKSTMSPPPASTPITPPRQKVSSRYPMRRRKRKPTHLWKRCDFDKFYHEFYSSGEEEEDEDENEESTLFSSRSDSSTLYGRNGSLRMRRKTAGIFGKQGKLIMGNTKVEELGYPVTKKSKDPYSDFRDSMVEMIVDRQLFGASDLEKLLKTFLSLNSSRHHGVITKVYTEIQQTLFSSGF